MSDNLHRVIEDRRDTNSGTHGRVFESELDRLDQPPRPTQTWWSQTGSNRRPPACKAGALPTELWPRLRTLRALSGGPGKTRTSDLTLIKRAL